MTKFINYSSAPCGSHKTTRLLRRAEQWAGEGRKVLLIQPSIELIQNTMGRIELTTGCPIPKAIHGQSVENAVVRELIEHMTTAEEGQILFATHQVLALLPQAIKNDWHLLVDEVPQASRCMAHKLPITHALLTDHMKIEPYNNAYGRVVADPALHEMARNKHDDEVLAAMAETIRILTNSNWRTFVNLEQYTRLKNGEVGQLTFHSVLQPSILDGFKSVFITAANFEDSELYCLWEQAGVKFRPDQEFTDALKFTQHTNGALITILYATEETWSRRYMDKNVDDNETVLDAITAQIPTLLTGPFVWQANKRVSDKLFDARRLPNVPHGLNDARHVHQIAFFSALNPSPDHFRFLQSQGMTSEQIRACTYFEAVYQSVMRTSIRVPDNTDPKTIFVPDRSAAEFLQAQFPGSSIQLIESELATISKPKRGRPTEHDSNAERMQKARQKERQDKRQSIIADHIDLQSSQYDSARASWDDEESGKFCAEITIESNSIKRTHLVGGLYHTKKSPLPYCEMPLMNRGQFVDSLRDFHQRTIPSKDAAELFCPAIFDPDKSSQTKRGLENILHLWNIWLDFENGDLTPEEFPKLFPNVEMLLMNTYRHTKDAPRFRVIMFTKSPMTDEGYKIQYNMIADKLNDAGYSINKRKRSGDSNRAPSGLDWGKSSPHSLFFLPSQANSRLIAFFKYCTHEREPLDPVAWLQNTAFAIDEDPVYLAPMELNGPINQWLVDAAVEKWRNAGEGMGNDEFFSLGLSLWKAGLDDHEIRAKLTEEARHAHSPSERRAQIPTIMRTLSKYRRSTRSEVCG